MVKKVSKIFIGKDTMSLQGFLTLKLIAIYRFRFMSL